MLLGPRMQSNALLLHVTSKPWKASGFSSFHVDASRDGGAPQESLHLPREQPRLYLAWCVQPQFELTPLLLTVLMSSQQASTYGTSCSCV